MAHLSYNRLDVPEDAKGWTVLGIGPEAIGGSLSSQPKCPTISCQTTGETVRTRRLGRFHTQVKELEQYP